MSEIETIARTWNNAVKNRDVTPIIHIVQEYMELIHPLSLIDKRRTLTLMDVLVDHMTNTLIVMWHYEEMEATMVWTGAVDSLFRPSGPGTLQVRWHRTDDVVRMDLAEWIEGAPFGEGVELVAHNPVYSSDKSHYFVIDLYGDKGDSILEVD